MQVKVHKTTHTYGPANIVMNEWQVNLLQQYVSDIRPESKANMSSSIINLPIQRKISKTIYVLYKNDLLLRILGKDDSLQTKENGLTYAVVVKLLEGVEKNKHHVYMDNLYTSPTLFKDLKASGFEACGTARTDRIGMPRNPK